MVASNPIGQWERERVTIIATFLSELVTHSHTGTKGYSVCVCSCDGMVCGALECPDDTNITQLME